MINESRVRTAADMSENFAGEQIAQLKLDALVSDGTFAQVYRASEIGTERSLAVKIAKPPAMVALESALASDSQALEQITGALAPARPDPISLIQYQIKIAQNAGACCPQFHSVLNDTDRKLFGWSMEYIQGTTLATLISERVAGLHHVIAVARALKQFQMHCQSHGDLKPANIIVCPDGQVKLLDPGFFGKMKSADGDEYEMKITTPLYYPLLIPDDCLAIGLMAWEVLCGCHPLRHTATDITVGISDRVKSFLSDKETRGQFYLSSIVNLSHPERLMPIADPIFQKFLLKLIKLSLTEDGVLDLDEGYNDISEVIDVLKTLESLVK